MKGLSSKRSPAKSPQKSPGDTDKGGSRKSSPQKRQGKDHQGLRLQSSDWDWGEDESPESGSSRWRPLLYLLPIDFVDIESMKHIKFELSCFKGLSRHFSFDSVILQTYSIPIISSPNVTVAILLAKYLRRIVGIHARVFDIAKSCHVCQSLDLQVEKAGQGTSELFEDKATPACKRKPGPSSLKTGSHCLQRASSV